MLILMCCVNYDRSRLGRTAALSMTVVELCREAGIACYDIESPPSTLDAAQSTDDLLIGAIKSVGAQSEIRKLVERRAKGMRGRVLAGKMPSKPNFGYMYDESRRNIIINEHEAAIVRRSLELYLQGRGSDIIVDTIQKEFGVNFYYSKFFRILNKINVYAGYSEFNAFPESIETRYKASNYIKARGNWQPIISEETAKQVIKERGLRNKKSASERQSYILSGVCICSYCNKFIAAHKTGDIVYMRCRDGKHKKKHAQESVIVAELQETLSRIVSDEDLPAQTNNELITHLEQTRTAHENTLQRLTQARKRADDAYVDGLMSPNDYKAQITRLQGQQDALLAQIEELAIQIDYEANRTLYESQRRQTLRDVHDKLSNPQSDIQQLNYLLRHAIRIYVKDGHIERIAAVT